ncbi:Ig-like domain-containing protein [Candidatus Soleaferrea massiliensis]|uniref:Ig-like domain-containing protein n=1 Tax=Candidatus Soleaferrea massiliensis TaxID=1470354 RepID=UPI000694B478|nr:Ig-like domain-containing protein [Candidatus Soleaferrea massiliensis]
MKNSRKILASTMAGCVLLSSLTIPTVSAVDFESGGDLMISSSYNDKFYNPGDTVELTYSAPIKEKTNGIGMDSYEMYLKYQLDQIIPAKLNGTQEAESLNCSGRDNLSTIARVDKNDPNKGISYLMFIADSLIATNSLKGDPFLKIKFQIADSMAGQEANIPINMDSGSFIYDKNPSEVQYVTFNAKEENQTIIRVDQKAPTVKLNGTSYSGTVSNAFTGSVKIDVEDLNLRNITLDGKTITSGTSIGTDGKHTVVATDAAGNQTTTIFNLEMAPVNVTGVKLNKNSDTLTEGETLQLTATVSPSDATNKGVSWKSSDNAIATVKNGLVTAVAPGKVDITVTTLDGSFTDTCKLTIEKAPVRVTGIQLDKTAATLNRGDSMKLNASVIPADADNQNISWKSSDDSKVTVDQQGNITAVVAGSADITVTSEDGSFEKTCAVTVVVPVTDVTLNKETADMFVGDSLELEATILPADATNKEIRWTSSNSEIASVENGRVTALKAGDVTINATSVDGNIQAQCSIHIDVPVSGVRLDKTEETIYTGATLQLTATVLPEDAANKNVTWSVDDPSKASVENGLVTAKAVGQVVVTVTTEEGGFKATCTVNIEKAPVPVTGVRLDKNTATIEDGKTLKLNATVLPEDANNQNVTWSVDDESKASVENGLVTAKAPGQVVVTVTTEEGGFTETCTIQIDPVAVTGVELDKQTGEVKVGGTLQLNASVLPSNASNKEVIWSVNDESKATVENGLVTALKGGEVVVTVRTVDGSFEDTCTLTIVVPVTEVTLDHTSGELKVGETLQLLATVLPEDATNKEIRWNTSNSAVATVENGLVTALKGGEVTISATSVDGNITAQCKIVVVVPVTGVELDKTTADMKRGEKLQLNASVLPADATNQEVIWSVSDDSKATVENGLVTAIGGGEVTVTATTADGSFEAECVINITVPVTGVELDKTSASINLGETLKLNAKVQPADADNQEVIWSVSDDSKATVENGLVTAIGGGEVVVTATTVDGDFEASCTVTVIVPVTGIELDITDVTIYVGDSLQLNASVIPEDATNQNVSWSVNEPGKATVENGLVKALAAGEVIVTVKSEDGNFEASCTLTIENVRAESIALDQAELSLPIGQSAKLNATILPNNTTNKNVLWSSSDDTVASVAADGTITALKAGNAVITATAEDSEGALTATCNVTVTTPVSGVELDKSEEELRVGETVQLTANVLPADADNKEIRWSVSDSSILSVEDGLVTALKGGEAYVNVATVDGNFQARCKVAVIVDATGVELDKTEETIQIGDTLQLNASVLPADATEKKVTWSVDDEEKAEVSEDGMVTAKVAGDVVVTATTVDGGFTAECTIHIEKKSPQTVSVTGVKLNKERATIGVKETLQLSASILPENASNKNVSWTSSNPKVATVSKDGKVTGIAKGTATITVKTADGNFTAKCVVTVTSKGNPQTGANAGASAPNNLTNGIVIAYSRKRDLLSKDVDLLGQPKQPNGLPAVGMRYWFM